jgi:hypothetical protein
MNFQKRAMRRAVDDNETAICTVPVQPRKANARQKRNCHKALEIKGSGPAATHEAVAFQKHRKYTNLGGGFQGEAKTKGGE